VDRARRSLRVDPRTLIAVGLVVACASALFALPMNLPVMTAAWMKDPVLVIGKVGTPILFDIGVYLIVLGVTLTMIFSLAEE
jgi:multicomponent Na+:H+ antiporter subunit B